ncbi:MAG TPA: magnesium transporter CorA family protein, partial [Burkholderiaceae bacterium]|nr:magnesium transporter CorA family protein [Burkholderiaceae bacterium]
MSHAASLSFLHVTADKAVLLPGAPDGGSVEGWYWADCSYEDARSWVEPVHRLTGITVFEDHLLDAENQLHPSYFDSTRDYEMIVFRGLAPSEASTDENRAMRIRTRPTVVFLFPGCLVTVRSPDSTSVPALRRRLLAATTNRQRLPGSPEELMLRLLNNMVDRYLELRQPLTEQLERWQRLLLDPGRPFHDWYSLLEARGEIRKLEQLCEEQLDALQEWRDERMDVGRAASQTAHRHGAGFAEIADPLLVRTSDVVEHIQRVLSHARRLESSVESAVQLHFSSTAHRTSEIMRTLTTLTAIFMPLTLITGIFGMNFEVMPGLRSPAGFWWTMVAMATISIGLL